MLLITSETVVERLESLGDALANPKTVIAWVMAAVGAPTAMLAWLVPLRESGALLPQPALELLPPALPLFGHLAAAAALGLGEVGHEAAVAVQGGDDLVRQVLGVLEGDQTIEDDVNGG